MTDKPESEAQKCKSMRVWESYMGSYAQNTRDIYNMYFKRFLEWADLDPETLYQLRLEHIRSNDPRDRKILEYQVASCMREMHDQGLAPSTCNHVYKAVRSFFEAQGLDFKIKAKDRPRIVTRGKKVFLKDQIREMLDMVGSQCRHRNRALILVAKDTGLRISDLASMTVGWYRSGREITNKYGERFKVFKPVRSQKTGGYCYPHMGPEALDAVDTYLEIREQEQGRALDPDQPLWHSQDGGGLSRHAIGVLLRRLSNKLGPEGDDLSGHSLRKYFETNLEADGVHKNWIGKYFDKQVTDSSAPYSRPEDIPGLLTETYMDHYDALRVKESADVKQMRAKITELEKEQTKVNKLEEDITEMRELFREYLREQKEADELAKELEKQ